MRVEIKQINQKDREVTVKLFDDFDLDTFMKNQWNGRMLGFLEPWIKGTTTDLQRKHYWALIGDIADYTGDPQWKIVLNMKYLYMVQHDKTKEPSMARNKMKMEDAQKLIQTIIDYCLDNEITLNGDYLPYFEQNQLFKLTMKRMCWVCGKRADIHHVDSLGAGRNRETYQDHDKHTYMALCREHHNLAHQMGKETFEETYHVKGITLSNEHLKELGVI